MEYENEMLLDASHDGLVISARGLGIEHLLIKLLKIYSDAGNLVLIVGTSQSEEEYIISHMQDVSPQPIRITAECSVSSRSEIYMNGGCIFVTSRILVVDLLMERVPIQLITGMIIWKAHKILESCQEAFILRLYRMKNKTGFIKALSSSAVSFTIGFCHVERVMKNLFVKKLYLWPRFRLEVSDSLSKYTPEVIEIHTQMSENMINIQACILDLITTTLQELKLSNRSINLEEFTTENAISQSFDSMVRLQLDSVWHQLSARTKQLVADLKILRTLLTFLTQYDCVTFYNLVNSLMTTEKVLQSAGWMLLPAAESMVQYAKARVLAGRKERSKPEKTAKKVKLNEEDPQPEVNPKWISLLDILNEVKTEGNKLGKVGNNENDKNQYRKNAEIGCDKNAVKDCDKKFEHDKNAGRDFDKETEHDKNAGRGFDKEAEHDENAEKDCDRNTNSDIDVDNEDIKTGKNDKNRNCLIVTHDDKTANQLKQFLIEGADKILLRNFYQVFGPKLNLKMPVSLFSNENTDVCTIEGIKLNNSPLNRRNNQELAKNSDDTNKAKIDNRVESKRKQRKCYKTEANKPEKMRINFKDLKKGGKLKNSNGDENNENAIEKSGNNESSSKKSENNESSSKKSGNNENIKKSGFRTKFSGEKSGNSAKVPEEITLTQIIKQYPKIEEKETSEKINNDVFVDVFIHSLRDYNDPFKMIKMLESFQPSHIIMYDCDLEFVRRIETWQARDPSVRRRVYFMMYKNTVEEQVYLTSIKREKNAFEYLIKEKNTMLIPEYADGRHDDHPDLRRDIISGDQLYDSLRKDNQSNESTRKGGGTTEETAVSSRIIVDMREFRSELPAILHRKGIDIDPATIEVGDYILSPDTCVERKSISDLIGSLNSGRLYNQALAMSRHYNNSILLIEFDHNKPFYLQGRLFLSRDISAAPKDVCAKLQLLTLHFPRLKILWSPSPYATADIFHMLKRNKSEPSIAEAQTVSIESNTSNTEKFNPFIKDFILKLPGINSKNIAKIMTKASSLTDLLNKTLEELQEILENSKDAKELYFALHNKLEDSRAIVVDKKAKTRFGKAIKKTK